MKKVKKEKKSKKSVNGGAAKKKVKKAKEEQPEEEEEGEDEPIGFGEVDPDRELVEYDSVEIFSKESWEVRPVPSLLSPPPFPDLLRPYVAEGGRHDRDGREGRRRQRQVERRLGGRDRELDSRRDPADQVPAEDHHVLRGASASLPLLHGSAVRLIQSIGRAGTPQVPREEGRGGGAGRRRGGSRELTSCLVPFPPTLSARLPPHPLSIPVISSASLFSPRSCCPRCWCRRSETIPWSSRAGRSLALACQSQNMHISQPESEECERKCNAGKEESKSL